MARCHEAVKRKGGDSERWYIGLSIVGHVAVLYRKRPEPAAESKPKA